MSRKQYRQLSDHQSWFIAHSGIMLELKGTEAMDYLKKQMKLMSETFRHARALYKNIRQELKNYKSSADIINDVLKLDEILSLTELYCTLFLEQYDRMSADIESLKREYLEPPF